MTPHSARKVQKMPASGISSELRAHQMAPGGVVAHSSPPARVVAHPSPPAGAPSRRCSEVCARYFDRGFFVWCCTSVPRRLWYRYWDARMTGERGTDVGVTFAEVYFLFFFFAFHVPCATGANPASHGVRLWRGGSASTVAPSSSSFLSSCSSTRTSWSM